MRHNGTETMRTPDRHMLIGMTLGALSASVLAITGPGMVVETFADELIQRIAAPGIDPSKLVRFEDKDYVVEQDDWVSTDPLTTTTVRKIEGGKVSTVTITTTSTGTYSSDAMFSPHVQYPGISVKRAPDLSNAFAALSNGDWTNVQTASANSFLAVITPVR